MSESLRRYLAETGGSRGQFADRVGISQSHLSMILSGQRRPSARLARRISRETGVPLEELLFNEVA